MLASFATLLVFQCLGEGITFALKLPIPGPVVGMLLLFFSLVAYPPLLEKVEATASELLRHLSLLFVPAGVGIVAAAGQVKGHWLTVILAVAVSTLLTLAVTATVTRAVMNWQKRREALPGKPEEGKEDGHA
ncbi:CidA/LrgA family protein [Herbaspirillum rhizosphaerae]|uniref:CidA/LrgA family protein n=1 Tax=Herbaspirillum rhizosphaerae TaxID=346179 RepID=A0ABW8Z9A2_9BURK